MDGQQEPEVAGHAHQHLLGFCIVRRHVHAHVVRSESGGELKARADRVGIVRAEPAHARAADAQPGVRKPPARILQSAARRRRAEVGRVHLERRDARALQLLDHGGYVELAIRVGLHADLDLVHPWLLP